MSDLPTPLPLPVTTSTEPGRPGCTSARPANSSWASRTRSSRSDRGSRARCHATRHATGNPVSLCTDRVERNPGRTTSQASSPISPRKKPAAALPRTCARREEGSGDSGTSAGSTTTNGSTSSWSALSAFCWSRRISRSSASSTPISRLHSQKVRARSGKSPDTSLGPATECLQILDFSPQGSLFRAGVPWRGASGREASTWGMLSARPMVSASGPPGPAPRAAGPRTVRAWRDVPPPDPACRGVPDSARPGWRCPPHPVSPASVPPVPARARSAGLGLLVMGEGLAGGFAPVSNNALPPHLDYRIGQASGRLRSVRSGKDRDPPGPAIFLDLHVAGHRRSPVTGFHLAGHGLQDRRKLHHIDQGSSRGGLIPGSQFQGFLVDPADRVRAVDRRGRLCLSTGHQAGHHRDGRRDPEKERQPDQHGDRVERKFAFGVARLASSSTGPRPWFRCDRFRSCGP